LEPAAITSVPPVEVYGMTGEQAPHHGGYQCRAGFQQQVEVARGQRPGVAGRPGVGGNISERLDALLSVAIVLKNRSFFNAPQDGWCRASGAFKRALRGMKMG
jgi:hypothetical protein